MRRLVLVCSSVLALFLLADITHAAVADRPPSRFDRLTTWDAVSGLGIVAETPDQIADFSDGQAGWASFRSRFGDGWRVHVDRRSGAPLLVQGPGLAWFAPGERVDDAALESRARTFLSDFETLFRVRNLELRLDETATAMVDDDRAVVAFDRVVDGVPFEGQRFVLYLVRGNLVSFGAARWSSVGSVPAARYGVETARSILYTHMGIVPSDRVEEIESGTLVLTAAPPPSAPRDARWNGPVGQGLSSRLVRRFVLRVAGEPGGWVGKVDAVTGEVVALYDNDKYAQVKGSIYPVASDGDCAKGGCLRADFPMPYPDVNVGGTPGTANDAGIFDCTGGTTTTTLIGPFVRISDSCGTLSESTVCDEDLDLGAGVAGTTNCVVAAGESAGNTHASRSAFYTINRVKEKGRYWLPSNAWLQAQVTVNTNVNSTCNATWGGSLNMYRAGNGCRNTGETAGVLNHEYGHGLDQNDGGGFDNPSEAYGDVVAILSDRASCVGRGFFETDTCSGYGDTCLSCTGIRDHDYAARTRNTPATPANFTEDNCGGGGGPCGREEHCEAYPPAEAVYDLAARDLPAAGLDTVTAWQTAERIFYKSRQGSGGNAFNCSLPSSDGCNAGGWYNTIRIADDDDGNLSNGTPHGAAIFAAFNRHGIACGSAADNSNKSTSSCPALAAPTVSTVNGSGAVTLNWGAVTNASSYRILRTEVSCDFTQNVIATVVAPGTQYVDTDLPNGTTFFYRVQAIGSNSACDSPVSACVQGTPQPFAGTIKLDRPAYSCSGSIVVRVTDANTGASAVSVTVASGVEPAGETFVLPETSPGSGKFIGTLATTAAAPSSGDGALSVANGSAITATYIDANDGVGGTNLTRLATATGDCVVPAISQVRTTDITDIRGTVRWDTNEASSSVVRWGQLKPPSSTSSVTGLVGTHAVQLNGLQSCTIYWYQVESEDVAGNLAVDANGGQYHYFETLGDLGSGLQACNSGVVTIDKAVAACSDVLPLKLTDLGLNASPTAVDTVLVSITSTTQTTPELVTLTETGANTSRFLGSIPTAPGAPVVGDGILQVSGGDLLTATYQDADDGTGAPRVSFDTSDADCSAPNASAIQVTQITDSSVAVQVTTSEPTRVQVDWGATASLGTVVQSNTLLTTHTLALNPLPECGRFHFRVTATDAFGNQRVFDSSGVPFQGNAGRIPPGVFKDSFETLTGWTLEGEWQIGTPQGAGSAPADPSAAYEGTRVLGHDLTGLGANPGNYENGVTQKATSPVINAAALAGGQLRFRRWLNVAPDAIASIEVLRGGINIPIWSSESSSESSWSLQTVGLNGAADGSANVRIIFKMKGPTSGAGRSSWNLDRVIVNSSSQPSFEACGGCTGAPTFAGATGAVDVDPCADNGIRVSWSAAPAWGTGSSGTYDVFRSTDPAFTPSAANQVASGVTGTSWVDATAPNNTTFHYVVRARNNESCSGTGLTESNVIRVSAQDQTSQSVPGDLGSSVRASGINDAHVRVSWNTVAGAVSYNVYRSQTPSGTFTKIGSSTGTFYEDRDQLGNATPWYYRVRGANACGTEGP